MRAQADDPRARAHSVAAEGAALLAHAINACDNPAVPYKYGKAARRRFMELMQQLYELVDTGEIMEMPIYRAKQDQAFQTFLRQAQVRPSGARNKARKSLRAKTS